MNKKIKVGALSLGFTYAGSFFGAGYVSGKELFEFFGSFGIFGYFGIFLSILLFFIFGVLLVRTVQLSGKNSFDEVIILKNTRVPRLILGVITVFMMFGILVVMTAGAGALINQVFENVPHYIGCFIFITLAVVGGMFGLNGIIKILSTTVPVLVIVTLIISGASLLKYGISFNFENTNTNPLLFTWWFSSLTYVSYNMITLIGTIIPVGANIKKRSTVLFGILIGCMLALSVALGILVSVTSIHGASEKELPMLYIAFSIGNVFGIIYAVLLLAAMYGTTLSSLVAINVYLENKIPGIIRYSKPIIVLIGFIAFLFGLIGFGNLVNTVYPIFGYIGFVVLILIVVNYIFLKLKKERL